MKAKQRRRRKLAAKQARRYVSVRDHGAVGDASTDDRAAIQRAISPDTNLGLLDDPEALDDDDADEPE